MAGEGGPDTSPKEPAKYKQISLGLHGGPPSEKSSIELGLHFTEEGEKFRAGLEKARKKSPLGQFAAEEISKLFPHRFKEEGVYFLGDKYSVLVIARWKEGGGWCRVPLIWKVEIKGKIFSLKRTPHPSFDFEKRLSLKNLEKVEDLARSFIKGILEDKRPAGGETKRMEIVLDPQADLPKEERGEESFSPQEGQLESSYINPSVDNEDIIRGKIRIIEDERNPRKIRVVLPLKEGEVIFVFEWTGGRDNQGLGISKAFPIVEGEDIFKKMSLGIVEKLERLARSVARQRFAD